MSENDEKMFLADVASKIQELESHRKSLDSSIYKKETSYLESTQSCGNILRGWDQFFTTKSKIGGIPKKTKFSFNERLFSQSSYNNNYLREEGASSFPSYKSLHNGHVSTMRSIHHSNGTHKKKILSSLGNKKKKLNNSGIKSLIPNNILMETEHL
jgi:hypothetical protein